jgi:hypothetical protein
MAAIFHDWCNKNELRNYPLEDLASKESTLHEKLPDNFLVDANIWIPQTAGTRVAVSSAAITPALVTMTFVADGGGTPVPVAAISLTRPVTRYRKYELVSYYPGTGGWVSFGAAVDEYDSLSMVFDVFEATRLVPKITRSYDDLPLLSLGKKDRTQALTGLVEIRGGSDIEVLACTDDWPLVGDPDYVTNPRYKREIDGEPKDCIAIRLEGEPSDYENLYDYTGPCQKSPDSFQCDRRLIQRVNGVQPDCEGNIEIEFKNIPTGTVVDGEGDVVGLSLDYPLGLVDVCDPNKGMVLPEVGDLCYSSSSLMSILSQSGISGSGQSFLPSSSQSGDCDAVTGAYIETFDGNLHCWTKPFGEWEINNCQLGGISDSGWGMALLQRSTTLGREIQGFIKIKDTGVEQVGYLVFGYEDASHFWYLEVNAGLSRVIVGRRNGASTVEESLPQTQTLPLDAYIHVRINVTLLGAITTWINGVAGPGVTAVAGTLEDGPVGFATRQSQVVFDNLALDWWTTDPALFPAFPCDIILSSSSLMSSSSPQVSSVSSIVSSSESLVSHSSSSLGACESIDLWTPYNYNYNDDGPNLFEPTVVGTPQISTVTKKVGGGSLYLNGSVGSPDGIKYEDAEDVCDFGTGRFTVSGWFYPDSSMASGMYALVSQAGLSGDLLPRVAWQFTVQHLTGLGFRLRFLAYEDAAGIAFGDYVNLANMALGTMDAWHHFAISRQGSTWKLFLDGALVDSVSDKAMGIASLEKPLFVGFDENEVYDPFGGYIDDLQIRKGYARWIDESSFTPPTTEPICDFPRRYSSSSASLASSSESSIGSILSMSATYCSFLKLWTPFNYNALDYSPENHFGELVGDAAISSTVKLYGAGSLELPGYHTAYARVDYSNDFNFYDGDFTVCGWARTPGYDIVTLYEDRFRCIASTGGDAWRVGLYWIENGKYELYFAVDGEYGETVLMRSYFSNEDPRYISDDEWFHFAVTRSGDTFYLYLNGILSESVVAPHAGWSVNNSENDLLIGVMEETTIVSPFPGYVDELQLDKANARWIGENFTPYGEPDCDFPPLPSSSSAVGSMSMLFCNYLKMWLPFDENMRDLGPSWRPATLYGTPTISTTTKKLGLGAVELDGVTDSLAYAASSDWNFGSGAFTISGYVYVPSGSVGDPYLVIASTDSPSDRGWRLEAYTTGLAGLGFAFRTYDGGGSVLTTLQTPEDYDRDTWIHVAVSRDGNNWRLFVDGFIEDESTTAGTINASSNVLRIGARDTGSGLSDYMKGFLDELEIEKGYARYVDTFAPPQQQIDCGYLPSNSLSSVSSVSSGTPSSSSAAVSSSSASQVSASSVSQVSSSSSSAAPQSSTSGGNQPPVAQSQTTSTPEGVAKSISLVASDPEGDPLTWHIPVTTTSGAFLWDNGNGNVDYFPNAGWTGTDTFDYYVDDGINNSNTATVTIIVG